MLNADDTSDTLANAGALTSTQLTGLGMPVGITYTTIELLTVQLGSGGDTFDLVSTAPGTVTVLNTNDGADTVHILSANTAEFAEHTVRAIGAEVRKLVSRD